MAAKLAAVDAPEAVSVPVDTSPRGEVAGVGRVDGECAAGDSCDGA